MAVVVSLAQARASVSVATSQFTAQLVGEILPFWLSKGWDERRGGFHERFFFDKVPDSLLVRTTATQFRQITALARAADLGWGEGLRLAFRGLEYMLEHAWAPDGASGFAHVLAPDGFPMEPDRNPSDHALAITALATLSAVSDDAQVNGLLRLLLSYVEDQLQDAEHWLKPELDKGEPIYPVVSYLHLFEALLAAYRQLGSAHILERAMRCRRMLESAILDRETRYLPEFLDNKHQPRRETGAFTVSPHAHVQAARLIRAFERAAGLNASPLATHLQGVALRAAAPATGFLIERIDCGGRVHDSHTRLAAQCALARSWLAQSRAGIDGAQEAGEALIANIQHRFLAGPFRGGWHDRLTAQGEPAIDSVPATSLAALVTLAVEANAL